MPRLPGIFPCNSIYSNLNHVLWRAKEFAIPDNIIATVPWISWFIWKARNDKAFNGKDITPLETIHLAKSEAESWKLAQIIEKPHEEEAIVEEAVPRPPPPPIPKCTIDASWHKEDNLFGGGMILTTEHWVTTFGSFASNRVLTPLHTEFQTLLWAMKSSIQLDHSAVTRQTAFS